MSGGLKVGKHLYKFDKGKKGYIFSSTEITRDKNLAGFQGSMHTD